jgi:hypothetical protein
MQMSRPGLDHVESKTALKWTVFASVIALTGVGGSLWLSVGMGLKACPLCVYQRAFVMAVAGFLIMGLLTAARASSLLHLLALPATIAGLGVAVFHVWLELSGKLECPSGVLGFGTAPQQSLAVFGVLLVLLAGTAIIPRREGGVGALAIVAAAVVGALLGLASIKSAPPLPPAPDQPYDTPPIVCRPPFEPQDGR